ncbi:MAG TPA: cytochrome c [Blastocatellia bacterium]|nr:cytochrome c [Blastocatellia bacterium]
MSKSRLKIVGLVLCLAAVFSVSACRQDMHDNPRFEVNEDGANRQPPEGTVARGSLALAVAAPKAAVPGQVGSVGEDGFPFKLSADAETRKKEIVEILDRGESRFNITCLPCHGKLGDGKGMVALRGFRHPPTYHQDRLRNAPTSHFYDVMTNGFGAMPSYAEVVTPEDRWKIIAYIRALQASQNARESELNADDRQKLGAADKAGEKSGAPAPTPGGHGN